MQILQVNTPEQLKEIKNLFLEYAKSLDFDLGFQNFQNELADLPGKYALPSGSLLMAEEDGKVAGCVGLRKISTGICEMKRLYIRPEFRGRGLGKALAFAIIEVAFNMGYRKMRLDTVATMKEAVRLYRHLGFYEIDAYCFNPIKEAIYMELNLSQRIDKHP
jgi:ribosomal protein S18 acetylase RimI-like enzyme